MSSQLKKSALFVVLLAAAATSWLMRPITEPTDVVARTTGTRRVYYMNDAVFSGLDEQGRIIYRVAASRIEGSEEADELDLRDVEIRYVPDLEVPWLIRARSARTDAQRKILELSDVVIESTSEDPGQTARIEAADMQLEPETRIASTPGPVHFAIGASSINAVGLVADLRAEKIVLESNVNARVTP
jgi:LPS export ABC transporter protein LptC